jgi:hypothetical protein
MPEVTVFNRSGNTVGKTNRDQPSIRLTDLHPSDTAVRTNATAPRAIDSTDQPSDGHRIKEEKVSVPPISAMAVEHAASAAGVGTRRNPPDFALGIIKVAVAREAFGSEKLKKLAEQVRAELGDIDLLLDLSTELTALPDKDFHEISDKMGKLIARLEAHKIQIWTGGKKISKEQLSELKAQTSAQIDKHRTSIQTKISTEIQPEATNLQSIMNIVQQIIQSDSRLKKKTTDNIHR